MAQASDLLDLDDQYSATLSDLEDCDGEPSVGDHAHKSLKAACVTRWNSTLEMLQSVTQLEREVQTTLKQIGHLDLCLHEDELDFLKQPKAFLKPFKDMSDLFSCSLPMLSVIPLINMRIRKNCTVAGTDDEKIKSLKENILRKLDHRFPCTDTVKLNQILNPMTKDLIPREEATAILDKAMKAATQRNLITSVTATPSPANVEGTQILVLILMTVN